MRKGDRIVARHIFAILEQNKGVGMHFADIKKEMTKKGWFHMDYAILDNFKVLIAEGKIIKAERLFGIPTVREDGTAYLKVWNNDAMTIELGKLKDPDGEVE